jgi:hypothetical protein
MKTIRRFVAGNHTLGFGKYGMSKTVNELIELDPLYLKWCQMNLKHIRFARGVVKRLNKKLFYKNTTSYDKS